MSLPKSEVRSPLGPYRLNSEDFAFPLTSDGELQGKHLYIIYVCDNCGYPNIAKYTAYTDKWRTIRHSAEPVEWIPLRAEDHTFVDVPKRVVSAANEAFRCFSIQAYRASVIMARSVLEGIANEKIQAPFKINSKGEKIDKNLKEKIKNMKDEEVISRKLGNKASAIQNIGNGSTHNIFQEITKEDASIVLGFLDLVIREVYTQEAQLKKLGKTSDEIKREKEESRKQ